MAKKKKNGLFSSLFGSSTKNKNKKTEKNNEDKKDFNKSKKEKQNNKSNTIKKTKKETTSNKNNAKSKKEIPLKEGGRRWQIFRSKDYQVKSAGLKTTHPFLVIDEMNDSIVGISITHSEGRSGQNYKSLPNVMNEKSLYEKELKYLNKAKRNKVLKITALLEKIDHREFTYKEKLCIMQNINNLPSNIEKYEKWIELNKNKQ